MAHKRSLIEIITDAAMSEPPETVAAALAVGRRILANRAGLEPVRVAKQAPTGGKKRGRKPGSKNKPKQDSEADGVGLMGHGG